MPDLGPFHPIVVHFVVALLLAGVALRWLALVARVGFADRAAALLLVAGTLAAVVAVRSGQDAHELAEEIPGVRAAVEEHEEWGERTRNLFAIVAILEVGALAFAARRPRLVRNLVLVSSVLGLAGTWVVYETGEHGGELVYSYAGGVGTRTGDPRDVDRLLIAGLHHEARLDREAGRRAWAARLTELAAQRFPDDLEVQLDYAGSLLEDAGNPQASLALLGRLHPPAGGRLELRHGLLLARALAATGARDEGLRVLDRLAKSFPESRPLAALRASY
jgi:uncharacterized membrane protein